VAGADPVVSMVSSGSAPAMLAARDLLAGNGVAHRFIDTDADPLGNEPLFDEGGRMIGRATSGYYGHHLKKSLAIGYVQAQFASVGTELSILILGQMKRATVLRESPYDPENLELKA